MNLDYEQYKMVREALHERATVLRIAPHLSYQMPIMLPIYKLWQVRVSSARFSLRETAANQLFASLPSVNRCLTFGQAPSSTTSLQAVNA